MKSIKFFPCNSLPKVIEQSLFLFKGETGMSNFAIFIPVSPGRIVLCAVKRNKNLSNHQIKLWRHCCRLAIREGGRRRVAVTGRKMIILHGIKGKMR